MIRFIAPTWSVLQEALDEHLVRLQEKANGELDEDEADEVAYEIAIARRAKRELTAAETDQFLIDQDALVDQFPILSTPRGENE